LISASDIITAFWTSLDSSRWHRQGEIAKVERSPKWSEGKGGINITKLKVTVLVLWMVVLGLFNRLEEQEGDLLAEIGEQLIVLPIKLKDVLIPLLGHRIALLATDVPGKEYLVRELQEDKQDLPASWNVSGDHKMDIRSQKTASIAGSS
jgi:hypothetical protein